MENKGRLRSLAKRSDFESLRETGRLFHVNAWMLANARKSDLGVLRLGWTISRHIGPAVVRNRFRRWGREYLRKLQNEKSYSADLNVVFKRREKQFFKDLTHKEFDEALAKLATKLERAIE